MAEGWARALLSDRAVPYSAGIEKHGLNPRAVKVMREAGVDISEQRSKTISQLVPLRFDLVVGVCDTASDRCPTFPGAPRFLRAGFDDPPKLAAGAKTEEEALVYYRQVRDQIKEFVQSLLDQ